MSRSKKNESNVQIEDKPKFTIQDIIAKEKAEEEINSITTTEKDIDEKPIEEPEKDESTNDIEIKESEKDKFIDKNDTIQEFEKIFIVEPQVDMLKILEDKLLDGSITDAEADELRNLRNKK